MLSRILGGIVLLALGFVLVQFAQPYMHSYEFEQMVRKELDADTIHPGAASVHRRVLNQARDMGFAVSDEDVQVERLRRGFQVRIHYMVPLDLRVYKSGVEFTSAIQTTSELQ